MRLEGFSADADFWGRRVALRWSFALNAGETPGQTPRVVIRRKEHDFEFPTPDQGQPDPFVVYDSTAFPPAGATLFQAPVEWRREDEGSSETRSESALVGDREVLRRDIQIHSLDGQPVRVTVRLLDASEALAPLTPCYYQLDAINFPAQPPLSERRLSVIPTERYELGRKLYGLLPEIYRRHDLPASPRPSPYPEAAGAPQLRRFLDLFGSALDYLRTQAEGLRNLHDLNEVEARHLPLLARWIGWDLQMASAIPLQRHEIRYAPALYRITGTIPGTMIWVKRLTNWNNRVKEFGRNVFFSNDTGNPDDPTDKGSRTVDTEDPKVLAQIGEFDDEVDYTYDTGEGAWYAYDAVGIFLEPQPNATPAEIDRVVSKLTRNLSLFLPTNIRGVVILDVPESSAGALTGVNLIDTEVN